jgi:outer membrane protein assembly factor BamE (lipoprotein component of BamABCDE complex)
MKNNKPHQLLAAAALAATALAGCRTPEERQDDRTARVERRQDFYDDVAAGSEDRREIRSERMDRRVESSFDSW